MSEIEAMSVSNEAVEAAARKIHALLPQRSCATDAINSDCVDDMARCYCLDEIKEIQAIIAALPFLARPAPSQSDEEAGEALAKYIEAWWSDDDESSDTPAERATKALAAVRAEATLAGAAAERERIAEWLYAEEDEKELAAAIRRMKP